MSVTIYLRDDSSLKRFNVASVSKNYETEPVFQISLTGNLATMANEAGLFEVLYRADEIPIDIAKEAAPLLFAGLVKLQNNPEYFKRFDLGEHSGSYDRLMLVTREYLVACLCHPNAKIAY